MMSKTLKISTDVLSSLINQGKKEGTKASSSKKFESKDKSNVIPMKNWIEVLKKMPEKDVEKMMEKHHKETLKEIKDKITSGYYETHFEEDVFPRLVNELIKDWGLLK